MCLFFIDWVKIYLFLLHRESIGETCMMSGVTDKQGEDAVKIPTQQGHLESEAFAVAVTLLRNLRSTTSSSLA